MFKSIITLFLALMLFPFASQAEYGSKGEWEVGPYIGIGFPDEYDPFNAKNDILAGGRIGYNLTDCLGAEVSFHRLFSEAANGDSANLDSGRLNLLLNFMKDSRIRPFITAGVGLEMTNIGNAVDETDLGWNGGIGAKAWLVDWLGLRLDARYWGVDVDGPINGIDHNAELTLGMFFSFGGGESAPAPVEGDADGDGVKDNADQCANTPSGADVDDKGCPSDSDKDGVYNGIDKCDGTPEGVKVDNQGCELKSDKDGDGVDDKNDKCDGTPSEAKVDESGCPLDSDGDGVADHLDKCSGTDKGEKVDEFGCPEKVAKARGALKGVNFETSSATLKQESYAVLDEVAGVLKEFQEFRVEVQGHTDSLGDDKLNLQLSQRRAQAVADYLAGKGVDAKRFDVKGYGESKPVAPNNTKDGRLKNRRVELNWLN